MLLDDVCKVVSALAGPDARVLAERDPCFCAYHGLIAQLNESWLARNNREIRMRLGKRAGETCQQIERWSMPQRVVH